MNREKELKEVKAILSGRPNLVYFVYGPINSGKTALLMKVFEELPEEYCVFYINFRGVETSKYEDFVRAMFQPRDESFWGKLAKRADIIKAAVEYVEKLLEKVNFQFEVPSRLLRELFKPGEKERDVFKYLEVLMRELVKKKKRPIFVLDELQMLREVNKNGPVLHDLFNFLVRMTKETHLCHCLCATSDCLFIEDVYANARLEGRAEYILVDDLDKEEAFRVYEEFGFRDKELVWDYIGGKFGDMIKLFERKKRGEEEGGALSGMLKDEVARLEWIKFKKLRKKEGGKEIWEFLLNFREKWEIEKREFEEDFDKLLFWIEENVLFYNPMEGTVRPQGRLLARAIRELF